LSNNVQGLLSWQFDHYWLEVVVIGRQGQACKSLDTFGVEKNFIVEWPMGEEGWFQMIIVIS